MGKGNANKRICNQCKIDKDFSEYSPHPKGKDGIRRTCKQCVALNSREYRNDPARRKLLAEKARVYRASNPDYAKNYRRLQGLKKYGLTEDSFKELLEYQNGLCAICKMEPGTHVDHDHETGHVRGILCANCNTGIGMLKDDSIIVENASKYLREHGR